MQTIKLLLLFAALVANIECAQVCTALNERFRSFNPSLWRFNSGCYPTNDTRAQMALRADHCHFNFYGLRVILDKDACPSGCTCGDRAPAPYSACEIRSNCKLQYGMVDSYLRHARFYNITERKDEPVNGVGSIISLDDAGSGQGIDFVIEMISEQKPYTHALTVRVKSLRNDPPFIAIGPISVDFNPILSFNHYAINWTRNNVDFLVNNKVVAQVPSSKFPTPNATLELSYNTYPIDKYFSGNVTPIVMDVSQLIYTPY
jgi:hypothetical protein